MFQRIVEKIQGIEEVKLAYLFGSRSSGRVGKMSDYDFAFYLDEKDSKKRFEIKIDLINLLSRELKTDKIDVVILNDADSPELKYNVIKDGKLIYEIEPFKVLIEPKILNEYFDFRDLLLRNNLTSN